MITSGTQNLKQVGYRSLCAAVRAVPRAREFSHLQSGKEVLPASQIEYKLILPTPLFTNTLLATELGFGTQ